MALPANCNGHLVWKVTLPSPTIPVSFAFFSVNNPSWEKKKKKKSFSNHQDTDAMTMSQYLGRGQVSRGRTTITSGLSMSVSTQPFFHDDGDKEAVIQGIKNLQAALANVTDLVWVRPEPGQTAEDYVDSLLVTANGRRANHWMGKFDKFATTSFTSSRRWSITFFEKHEYSIFTNGSKKKK